MFTTKKAKLFEMPEKTESINSPVDTSNPFLVAAKKDSARTRSGNQSLKYSTTGNDFLDQFANMGSYRVKRSYSDISTDCVKLWNSNPELAVRMTF